MATCRECICEDVCSIKNNVLCQLDTFVYEEYSNMPNVEKYCEHFKSKSDYIKRERGEWIVDVKSLKATCSVCGKILNFSDEMQIALLKDNENFCYYCGADNRKD